VRAKKATTPARSIRYLLYANRALQRISVRRLSARQKKADKPSRSSEAKKNAVRVTSRSAKAAKASPVTEASPSLRRIDRWWVAVGVAGTVGIAALIGVSSSPQQADRSSATIAADAGSREDAALDTVKPAAKAAGARTRAKATSTGSARTTEPAKSPAVDVRPAAEHPAHTEATASAVRQNAAVVRIEGCLQARDDAFWLNDTSGADAPQSRSWKSGFLKKHSSSVEVVDTNDALKLERFVGQRVAATGIVADRRMRAHLLQRVAASCG